MKPFAEVCRLAVGEAVVGLGKSLIEILSAQCSSRAMGMRCMASGLCLSRSD